MPTGQSTSASHTPGPWHVYVKNPLCIESREGNIALVNLARASEADARLIAAAPDLLALAKKLAGECSECRGRGYTFSDDGIVGFGPDDREPTREACAECADIRDVIAKAEGRS